MIFKEKDDHVSHIKKKTVGYHLRLRRHSFGWKIFWKFFGVKSIFHSVICMFLIQTFTSNSVDLVSLSQASLEKNHKLLVL